MNSITKLCIACKQEKSLSEFSNDKSRSDGLNNWCKACFKEWRKEYSKTDRAKRINSSGQLRNNYGITIDDYESMLSKQGGGCAVCGKKPNGKRLHVDHDHKTGAVRGLLCSNCNAALGQVNDDTSLLRRLIDYLT